MKIKSRDPNKESVLTTKIVGGWLILTGVIANHWLINALLNTINQDALELKNKIIIWFFQIICVGFGYSWFCCNTKEQIKKIYFSLALLFMMIFFIEGSLKIFYYSN
jgi:hypothetical protein